jgi:hypothetical protein
VAGRRAHGLDYLLELDGELIVLEDGTWAKFEARTVEPTPERPHGVVYCLTFHDSSNRRVPGFDNAHGVPPPPGNRVSGRRVAFDHRHRWPGDRGVPYEFESAAGLIADFWRAVDEWKAKQVG